MGNGTDPRATIIKAELCQAGLISHRDCGLPKCAELRIKLSKPLHMAERCLEDLFEAEPELRWHPFKCLQWTLITELRVQDFRPNLNSTTFNFDKRTRLEETETSVPRQVDVRGHQCPTNNLKAAGQNKGHQNLS